MEQNISDVRHLHQPKNSIKLPLYQDKENFQNQQSTTMQLLNISPLSYLINNSLYEKQWKHGYGTKYLVKLS